MRITLPGGEWAEMSDPADLTRRDVRAIFRLVDGDDAVDGVDLKEHPVDGMGALQDAAVVYLLQGWTVTGANGAVRALPTSVEDVQGLPMRIYGPLGDAALPALQTLVPEQPDPTSPPSTAQLAPDAPRTHAAYEH